MGRMTYVKALMCLLFPSAALVARAQHPVAGDLKCKLTGRMLMDGGVYLKNDNLFGNGTEFNDLRLGVKATYQNWSMKMEMGIVQENHGDFYTKKKDGVFTVQVRLNCEN